MDPLPPTTQPSRRHFVSGIAATVLASVAGAAKAQSAERASNSGLAGAPASR
jgi:hypothetical protein